MDSARFTRGHSAVEWCGSNFDRLALDGEGVTIMFRARDGEKPMNIRAAVLHAVGAPLAVETLTLAPPAAGEVLVRMGASGVCHSDYHVMTGQAGQALPVVLGHEGAGVVAAVGAGVDTFVPGDHVVLNWIPSCGTCFHCQRHESHLCRAYAEPVGAGTMPDGTTRLSKDGQPYRHLSMLATWADHTVVPAVACVRISASVPFEVAALLGCAVTTGVGAVLNKAEVEPGATVAVIGAGGVGLSLIMGAHLAGAGRIIVFDMNPEAETLARDFGASDFVPSSSENVEVIRAMTDGRGADYVFEAVGRVALQEMALAMTRPGGRLVLVGLAGNDDHMSLSGANLTRSEKTVCGSVFGSACMERDFNLYADHFEHGRLPIDRLVTRRYALDDINAAVAAMLGGGPGRGVIVFDGTA